MNNMSNSVRLPDPINDVVIRPPRLFFFNTPHPFGCSVEVSSELSGFDVFGAYIFLTIESVLKEYIYIGTCSF